MTLVVKNTFTRQLENFEPLVPGKVGMYVCGPTVYDYFHIGNARPFVVFDTVRRFLIHSGFAVTYVQNVTDIDDKIINRARAENSSWADVAKKYTDAYFEDLATLNVLPHDKAPRATETIAGIIDLIKTLEARGLTYVVDGDVFYRLEKFPEYGHLSGKNLDELRTGASGRTSESVESKKEHPHDFALWKAQKLPDEPAWDSPWGKGRPGWHIECSAMSMSILGESFDIHAGGEDLVFPHHENEIAQSEGATGKKFVRYWLHNGFLNIAEEDTPLSVEQKKLLGTLKAAVTGNDEAARKAAESALNEQGVYVHVDDATGEITFKAAKSLGNVPKFREVLERGFTGQEIRFLLVRAHYRGPITFSWSLLEESRAQLKRWGESRRRLADALETASARTSTGDASMVKAIEISRAKFIEQMEQDFNTPGAIAVIYEFISAVNTVLSAPPVPSRPVIESALKLLGEFEFVLGLNFETVEQTLSNEEQGWLDARATARKNREWAESDRLRDLLASHGIVVKDTPQGQKWHRESPA